MGRPANVRSAAIVALNVVETERGCWEWQRARHERGYGLLSLGGRTVRAHRFAWELFVGDLPDNVQVLHRCDNPPCCNPDHLFLGSPAINHADKATKLRGRSWRKLTFADAESIRALAASMSVRDIARAYGVEPRVVRLIIRRETYKSP